MALKRSMKLIQKGWRNGVIGVEGPEDQPYLDEAEGKPTGRLFENRKSA